MRCSFWSFSVAILLAITSISFSSPVKHDQHKSSIGTHNVPARSLENLGVHAVARIPASDGGNRHPGRRRDKLDPSYPPSPVLMQRHNHITDPLRLHTDSSSLAKRSLTGDLIIMGFKLIWDHADILVASYLAHHRTTDFYQNLITQLDTEFSYGPTVQNYIITYGVFRLTFSIMSDSFAGIAGELARQFPNGFGQFMQEFAQMMLLMAKYGFIATYTVLAYSVMLSIWVTMVIVENAQKPDMVTTP